MFRRSQTAFKHPKCGGVIYRYEWPQRTRFKCERCSAWADDLVRLSLGLLDQSRPVLQDELAEEEGDRNRLESAGGSQGLSKS